MTSQVQKVRRFKKLNEPSPARELPRLGGIPQLPSGVEWPISPGWNTPMVFLAQVPVGADLVAAAFITHTPSEEFHVDPDACLPREGENLLLVYPRSRIEPLRPPSGSEELALLRDAYGGNAVQFEMVLKTSSEPERRSFVERAELAHRAQSRYLKAISGNKLGGAPALFQNTPEVYEFEAPAWQLVLQLHLDEIPAFVNLGSSPTLFAMYNTDSGEAVILAQDS